MDTLAKYSIPMRFWHWLTSLVIISLLIVGFYMESLPNSAEGKWPLYGLHKAAGVALLGLMVLRLLTRLFSQVPALPAQITRPQAVISKIHHVLLYAAVLVMAVSGYVMSAAFPKANGVDFFGLFVIPDLIRKSEAISQVANQIHGITAWVLVALIVVHVLASIKHHLQGVPVLKRMM